MKTEFVINALKAEVITTWKNSASNLSEVSQEYGIFPNAAKMIADFYRGYFIDGEFNAGIVSHWHCKGNKYMRFYWPYSPEIGETEGRLLVKVHEVTGEALSPDFPTVTLKEIQSKFEQVSH